MMISVLTASVKKLNHFNIVPSTYLIKTATLVILLLRICISFNLWESTKF